jgi:PAS domain S-box-containing protein
MSSTETPIFQTIFEQSPVPAMIVKANAPKYTIVTSNQAYKLLTAKPDASQLASAFAEAIITKAPVKLNAARLTIYEMPTLWQQMEVMPILNEAGEVSNLYCTYHDISQAIGLEADRKGGLLKEQDLSDELTASNEELHAANEELSATNEELRQSQESLSDINRTLEERVEQRTKALSASEARFRTMVEQSPVPMLVTMGKSMVFDIINQPMLDLIGKDASVIGKPWYQAMPELEGQDIIRQLLDTYDNGKSWEGNEVPIVVYKSGLPVLGFYNITYKPLIENGKSIGMLQSAIDVTELVKSRLQMEDLNHKQQAANKLLEQIINILPASVVVIKGEDLLVESINKANLAYWNKTKEEVIGKPLLEILPELSNQPFPGQLKHVMATGEVIDVKESPVLFINPDGSQRKTFVDYTYQPLTDSDGMRSGVLVMSFEFTERVASRVLLEQYSDEMQAMNEELVATNEELEEVNQKLLSAQHRVEESQTALRLAIDAADFGTWFIHSETREFVTDARLKELFGYYPDEDLSIEQALAQITDEYRGLITMKLEKAIYENGDYDVTYPVVGLHDHRLRWLRAIGNLKADSSGSFSAFTGVVMDITKQYLANKNVERAEESLRLAIEAADSGTYSINTKTLEFFASPRLKELFGFKRDEPMSYEACMEQIREDYRPLAQQMVDAAIYQGKRFELEYPVIGFHDLKQRWLRGIGTVQHDSITNDTLFTGIINDITERKETEHRKDEFISIASHELKTPLTTIKAFFQLSKRETDTQGKINPFVDKAERQLERLGKLIEDLLDVSKINAGKMVYNKEDFDFGKLLREASDSIQQTTKSHHIEIEADCTIIYRGDQHRIEQVLINLLNNAIKYSPGRNKIVMRCELENQNIIVCVQDFGIGIAAEHLKGLFDRFYRVDNSSARFQGLGLGLFISNEIVKRHGGSFWIESEPNVGSTFYFLLPLSGKQEFTDLETDNQSFYEGTFIRIKYMPDGNYIDVDWIGYQNYDSVVKGCTIMLDLMKKNNCNWVLNNNTEVKGNWSEASDWGADYWFPAMAKAGLKKFAWVYSPSTFSRIAANKSLPPEYDAVQVAFFNNKQTAMKWLIK